MNIYLTVFACILWFVGGMIFGVYKLSDWFMTRKYKLGNLNIDMEHFEAPAFLIELNDSPVRFSKEKFVYLRVKNTDLREHFNNGDDVFTTRD